MDCVHLLRVQPRLPHAIQYAVVDGHANLVLAQPTIAIVVDVVVWHPFAGGRVVLESFTHRR